MAVGLKKTCLCMYPTLRLLCSIFLSHYTAAKQKDRRQASISPTPALGQTPRRAGTCGSGCGADWVHQNPNHTLKSTSTDHLNIRNTTLPPHSYIPIISHCSPIGRSSAASWWSNSAGWHRIVAAYTNVRAGVGSDRSVTASLTI
jgi:hypothetical protein